MKIPQKNAFFEGFYRFRVFCLASTFETFREPIITFFTFGRLAGRLLRFFLDVQAWRTSRIEHILAPEPKKQNLGIPQKNAFFEGFFRFLIFDQKTFPMLILTYLGIPADKKGFC